MTPERYQQIGRLYQDALSLEPQRRGVFLQEACAADKALLQSDIVMCLPFSLGLNVITAARSLFAADRVQMAFRPYQQPLAHQRGRRLGPVVQIIHVQQLELFARRDHERLALFAQAEQFAVVGPGRGRERRRRRVNPRPVSNRQWSIRHSYRSAAGSWSAVDRANQV